MKENKSNNKNLPSLKDLSSIEKSSIAKLDDKMDLRHRYNFGSYCWGVRSVNFSKNRVVITNANNAKIKIIDLDKLEALPFEFKGHHNSVRLTSISKDGKLLASASWDGLYKLWSLETGECLKTFQGISRSPSCFLDPELKFLFTASYDADINSKYKNAGKCWNISSERVLYAYRHTSDRISQECCDIAYDPEHRLVFTCSDDGIGQCWGLESEKPRFQYINIAQAIRKLAITEKYIGFACSDGYIRIHYKLSGERFKYFIHNPQAEVLDIKFSNDRIYSASTDGSVKCFNLTTGKLLFHSRIHSSWIWSISLTDWNNSLTEKNDMCISGSLDGTVAFIDALTGELIVRLINAPSSKEFILISPPDKVFENGFFYTSNEDYIEVMSINKEQNTYSVLNKDDTAREDYTRKHNLKNLMRTKLNTQGKDNFYNKIADQYVNRKKRLNDLKYSSLPKALNQNNNSNN